MTLPPSAFPDLVLPEQKLNDPKAPEKREADFERLCPRLTGKSPLTIDATDDTLRKLLKARIHQGVLQLQFQRASEKVGGPGQDRGGERELLGDLLQAATELWAKEPKELVAWLSELVIAAKQVERYTLIRVQAGTFRPDAVHAAHRLRLKIEAELWKAKNPK